MDPEQEPRMKDNIQVNDMVQCAIEYFKDGTKSSWEAYRKANGLPEDIAWEKFKRTLLEFRLVDHTPRTQGRSMDMKCDCKICGKIGHTSMGHRKGCPYYDASHVVEECTTLQVACFLCEG